MVINKSFKVFAVRTKKPLKKNEKAEKSTERSTVFLNPLKCAGM